MRGGFFTSSIVAKNASLDDMAYYRAILNLNYFTKIGMRVLDSENNVLY